MPDNAVPFQASGVVLSLAPQSQGDLINLRVRNDVNGLRIDKIFYSMITANIQNTAALLRNGVLADPALSGSFWAFSSGAGVPVMTPLDVFAFYEAGDTLQFTLFNPFASGTPNMAAFLRGWYF